MRWCSRFAAGESSTCLGGSEMEAVCSCRPDVEQPDSSRPSTSSAGRIRRPAAKSPRDLSLAFTASSVQLGDFDLLGVAGLDAWTVAFVYPAAHPDASVLQCLRRQSGLRKHALMTFQDRDRERFRPAPAEIHIDGAAALADRQHLAFCDREATPPGQKLCPAFGSHYAIIRACPKAKPGRPRCTFM